MIVDRKLRAHVNIPTHTGATAAHAMTITEINLSGCLIRTNKWLSPGTMVSFRITVPSGNVLELKGRVINQNSKLRAYGISFLSLSDEERKELALLIAESIEPAISY